MRRGLGDAIKGGALLVASLSVVGLAAVLSLKDQEPERDPASLCAPSLENGQTIVIIDKTDRWNDSQADRLEQQILWLVSEKMHTEEKLMIFAFSDQLETGFPPKVSFCKPPSGEDANDITKSRDYYNRRYKKQFADPLRAVLEDLKRADEKNCSPIMETLFDILTRREIKDHKGPTRIALVSDLAENSSLYSVYWQTKCRKWSGPGDPRKDLSKIIAFAQNRLPDINVKDTSVIVFHLIPPKNPPNIENDTKTFWSGFFRFMKIPVEWERL